VPQADIVPRHVQVILIVARVLIVASCKMNRGRNRLCVLTHAILILIVGLAIPVRETRVLLFVSQGNHQAPRQRYLEEVAAGAVIPTQTSTVVMASRFTLILDINLMV
jgi:hypothetical protein